MPVLDMDFIHRVAVLTQDKDDVQPHVTCARTCQPQNHLSSTQSVPARKAASACLCILVVKNQVNMIIVSLGLVVSAIIMPDFHGTFVVKASGESGEHRSSFATPA